MGRQLRTTKELHLALSQTGSFLLQLQSAEESRPCLSSGASAPKRETYPKKRMVITRMGLLSAFGNYIDTFYNKLLQEESAISLIDRFNASTFSVRFGGQIRDFSSTGYIDDNNDRRLDDCWRCCLVAGRRALEDASLGPQVLETGRIVKRTFSKVGTCDNWQRAISAGKNKAYWY